MSCKIISGFSILLFVGSLVNNQVCYFFAKELNFPINSDCVIQQTYGNMSVSIYLACLQEELYYQLGYFLLQQYLILRELLDKLFIVVVCNGNMSTIITRLD